MTPQIKDVEVVVASLAPIPGSKPIHTRTQVDEHRQRVEMTKLALKALARDAYYTDAEIRAGIAFSDRKSRRTDPPGRFVDRKFYASEHTTATTCCAPTRRWPYTQLLAARTAGHCAEIHEADDVSNVRRVCLALDRLIRNEIVADVENLLKKGIKARQARSVAGA